MKTQKTVLAMAIGLAFANLSGTAQAVDKNWNCSDSYWHTASCWNPAGLPGGGDNVEVHTVSGVNTVLRITGTTGTVSVNRVELDSTVVDKALILDQIGGSLTAANEFVGLDYYGSFVHAGGANTVTSGLYLGYNPGVLGIYALSGSGNLTANTEYIGYYGRGTFTQNIGTIHTVNNTLSLGAFSGGDGIYTQSGGTLNVHGIANGTGSGTFNLNGGTLNLTGTSINVDNFNLGEAVGSNGSFTLGTGQSFSAEIEIIGNSGTGSFIQNGGTNTVGLALVFGESGGNGTYTLNSGTLNVGFNLLNGSGSSTFNLNGGTLNVGGSIELDSFNIGDESNSNVSFTLGSGKTLDVGTEVIGRYGTGNFVHSGGTHTVSNALYVGAYGSGSYTLSGSGSLSANYEDVGGLGSGTGAFVQSGGTNSVNTDLRFADGGFGGNGTYTLSGGTLNVGGNLVDGGIYNGSTFNLDGGTLNVTGSIVLDNFNIGSVAGSVGSFALGRDKTIAVGTETIGIFGTGSFTQSGGFHAVGTLTINNGTYVLSGGTLTVDTSMKNGGMFELAGGTLQGNGSLINNANMSGFGTLGGSGGFTNNGFFTQGGGNLVLSNSGANANRGIMTFEAGRELRLSGANLSNEGSLALNGVLVSGSGTLTNAFGGSISGNTVINSGFANAGGTLIIAGGPTRVNAAFANSGTIQLGGGAASLNGGAITNSGTLEGAGQVGNAIGNSGTIEALGGTLTLGGAVTNTGLITAASGNKVLVSQGLPINAGVINLTGGTFDNNGHSLTNTNQISGYGTLRTGGLSNSGNILLTGGTSTVNGPVVNDSAIEVAHNPAIFTGAVTNNGLFKSTGTTVSFAGGYTENGLFFSDPATNIFSSDVTIGTNGVWTGGVGDQFWLGQDFINHSTRNADWDTDAALLRFMLGPTHDLALAGADMGASFAGYTDNFAWGILQISANQSLILSDGNASAGAALYVGEISGVVFNSDGIVSNIDGNGFNLYYNPTLANNAYLGGMTYALTDGGQLAPVPEPETWAMLLAGLGLIVLRLERQRRNGSFPLLQDGDARLTSV